MPSIAEQFTTDYDIICKHCNEILDETYGSLGPVLADHIKRILKQESFVHNTFEQLRSENWTPSIAATILAFDMRSPLNLVEGYSWLIAKDHRFYEPDPPNAKQSEIAQEICARAVNQRHTILAIADWFRMLDWFQEEPHENEPLIDLIKWRLDEVHFKPQLANIGYDCQINSWAIAKTFIQLSFYDPTPIVAYYDLQYPGFEIIAPHFADYATEAIQAAMHPTWELDIEQSQPWELSVSVATRSAILTGGDLRYTGDGVFILRLPTKQDKS
jgi:hypothetical protein